MDASEKRGREELLLEDWGYDESWREALDRVEAERPLVPGRVIFESREIYRVGTEGAVVEARLVGRLRSAGEFPAVGDWVALDATLAGEAAIFAVLPRRTRLSRKVAGSRTREQVVAANVDTVFLVMGLDGDFNLRRFERLAVMAWESGAQPVGVLSKADLVGDASLRRLDAQMVLPGAPVVAVSSLTGDGLEALSVWLEPARTVALVGSSGAGKSTLLNALCGAEVMRTGAVRASDQRGRHTTTHRQLVVLPGGALLVDNPGIREIQLWAEEGALDEAFEDVLALAEGCRFRDCRHEEEPGCGVLLAIEDGRLEEARLANWRDLQRELESLERRRDVVSRRREDRRLGKLYKRIQAAKTSREGR